VLKGLPIDETFAPNPRARAIMALRSAPSRSRAVRHAPAHTAAISKVMREAFAAALKDPALVAEGNKAQLDLEFTSGMKPQGAARGLQSAEGLVDEFSKYVKFGDSQDGRSFPAGPARRVLQWKAFAFHACLASASASVGLLPGLGGATTSRSCCLHLHHAAVEAFAFSSSACTRVSRPTATSPPSVRGARRIRPRRRIILDGHAMAKNGEAGRALGAALASSLIGALIRRARAGARRADRAAAGADVRAEMFMLAVVGLPLSLRLSTPGVRGMVRGFLAGGVGLFLALVGQDPQPASRVHVRHALPDGRAGSRAGAGRACRHSRDRHLVVRGTSIAGTGRSGNVGQGALQGVKDVFRHYGLTIRCRPDRNLRRHHARPGRRRRAVDGLRHATQSARNEEERKQFGAGDVRGVHRSRRSLQFQGRGALIPTIAFGVQAALPWRFSWAASSCSAWFPARHADQAPGRHLLHGLDDRARQHHYRGLCAFSCSTPRGPHRGAGHLLVPVILVLVFIGSYTSNSSYADVLARWCSAASVI